MIATCEQTFPQIVVTQIVRQAIVARSGESVDVTQALVVSEVNAEVVTAAVSLGGSGGSVGPQGPQGPPGPQGETGPQGEQGPTGATGPAGADGPPGADGATGPEGPPGADGADGADGATGPQGPEGPAGPTGPAGADGADGADGATGPTGPKGDKGDTGDTGPTGPKGDKGDTGDTGPAGPSVWGVITGSIPDQTDLQAALDAKADRDADQTFRTRHGDTGGGDIFTRNLWHGPAAFDYWADDTGARICGIGPDGSPATAWVFFLGSSPDGLGVDPFGVDLATGEFNAPFLTTTTQSPGDNSTKVATTAFVAAAVSGSSVAIIRRIAALRAY
jgi:hypothetical protein